MSASSVLLIAASIVAVEGNTATIDAGRPQHLEPGDRGQVFYELIVDGTPKRIEVGPVVVTAVDGSSATLRSESGVALRTGYRAELRLPVDRIPPPVAAAIASTRPPPDRVDTPGNQPAPSPAENPRPEILKPTGEQPPSRPRPAQPIPGDDPEHTLPAVPVDPGPSTDPVDLPSPAAVGAGGERNDSTSDRPVSVASEMPKAVRVNPPAPRRDVVFVDSGTYAIGLDPPTAKFFNQTPRHQVRISGFSIDRRAESEGRPLGLPFAEARARCGEMGLRLPTEEEWEVAAQVPGFVLEPGVFEWTSSWYQAYPGNSRDEEEYGRDYRVLRGIADGSDESLHTRRFMRASESNVQVAFRCVKGME